MLNHKTDRYVKPRKASAASYTFYAIIAFVLILAVNIFVRTVLLFPVSVNSTSMQKTINKGDRVFIVYRQISSPVRNDIVLVNQVPGTHQMLCRMVAMAGDSISMSDKIVIVNNKNLEQKRFSSDNVNISRNIAERDQMTSRNVRPGHFFCLNDNHDNLQDSRHWGQFPEESIVGRVVSINWLSF